MNQMYVNIQHHTYVYIYNPNQIQGLLYLSGCLSSFPLQESWPQPQQEWLNKNPTLLSICLHTRRTHGRVRLTQLTRPPSFLQLFLSFDLYSNHCALQSLGIFPPCGLNHQLGTYLGFFVFRFIFKYIYFINKNSDMRCTSCMSYVRWDTHVVSKPNQAWRQQCSPVSLVALCV